MLPTRHAHAALLAFAFLLAATIGPAAAAEPNVLTEQQAADGWISLFDGKTLYGWEPTSDADWKVERDAIRVGKGQGGFLMTTSDFADYELHVEFQCPDTTNSGIFLRTPLKPTDPASDCFELNIAPKENPFPTGSLVSRKKWEAGALAANLSTPPPLIGSTSKPGGAAGSRVIDANFGWHAFDARLMGSKITIWLDGKQLYAFEDSGRLARGRIALQYREGPVSFRNIRLRPVGLKSMLNGKDLAGWSASRAEASKFELNSGGELVVTGGRGQLETEAKYGDFIMQWDTFVDGDGLNSGVFFRSIPGDFLNGYECQISNAVVDNDPTKPQDAGTGAIYRRTIARRVVAKDRQWFTTTLVATGPHIAVWVSGQQVTDWTDDRPPHENPRNGLRLAPGTIALQGHDPTTNLRFKNLKIAELPEKTNHDDTTSTTKKE